MDAAWFFFQRAQGKSRERNLYGHARCALTFTVGQARYSLWGEGRWGKRAAYAIVGDAKTGESPLKLLSVPTGGVPRLVLLVRSGPVYRKRPTQWLGWFSSSFTALLGDKEG